MSTVQKFSLKQRARSFRFAFSGVQSFFATQHNARVHAFATVLVVAAAWYYHIEGARLGLLVVCIALVWMAELFNTAIEAICDFMHPGWHHRVKYIKDLAAAGVLVMSVAACIVALIVFLPVVFGTTLQ
jgi:diacylglycerol kinase